MPHSFIATDGSICFRSKLMPLSLASSFARCIQANASRFTDVSITPARRTKEAKYFVQFRPVSVDRQGALYQQQYEQRLDRAQEEGLEYIFWQDPDRREVVWCFNPRSGETYEVTPFNCTCPDYHYRCDKAGIKCKHQHALQAQADANRQVLPRSASDVAALNSKCRASRELDW